MSQDLPKKKKKKKKEKIAWSRRKFTFLGYFWRQAMNSARQSRYWQGIRHLFTGTTRFSLIKHTRCECRKTKGDWYLSDFSPSQDGVQGYFYKVGAGSRTNRDSCVGFTKMLDLVGIPLLEHIRRRAINSAKPSRRSTENQEALMRLDIPYV